jgi:hypothetical protein
MVSSGVLHEADKAEILDRLHGGLPVEELTSSDLQHIVDGVKSGEIWDQLS